MLQCPLEGGHRPRVAIEQLVPDVHDLGVFHGHLAGPLYRASAIFAITSHAVEIFAVACNLPCMASSPTLDATPRWEARPWALLVVLCGVLFLDGLNVSMVGVPLPSIRADLG